ncbi:hypothetical protein [Enterococcus phage PEF1]
MSIKNTKKDEKLFSSIYKEKTGLIGGISNGQRWQVWLSEGFSGFYMIFVARYLEDFCSPLLRAFLP